MTLRGSISAVWAVAAGIAGGFASQALLGAGHAGPASRPQGAQMDAVQATGRSARSEWPRTMSTALLPAPRESRPPPAGSVDGGEVASDEDPTDAQKRHRTYHDAFADRHAREGRDPSWAAPAEQGLYSGLAAIESANPFETLNVSCKMSTCKARIRWPNRQAAVAGFPDVLHKAFEPNCGRAILIPDVADDTIPVEVDVDFDCEESRAMQTQQ